MTKQAQQNLSLFDLLGRSWQRSEAISRLCFSLDGSAAAFASRDGTVAVATVADDEPPESRIHVSGDLGQTVIRPREQAPRPMAVTPCLALDAVPLAASGDGQFLLGSGEGKVLCLRPDGDLAGTSIGFDNAVVSLDYCPRTGQIIATDGDVILGVGSGGKLTRFHHDLDTRVDCLSLSPDGGHRAIAGSNCILVSSADHAMQSYSDRIECAGTPIAIAWSRVGTWLALALGEDGMAIVDLATARTATVRGFPTDVRTVCWSRSANALIAAGAFRIAAWSMDDPPFEGQTTGALETGRAGLVAVTSVAAHPKRDLVAAGYANGKVVVAQIGMRDELVVRPVGAAVGALAWSPDGRHLALGDEDGLAAIVTLPDRIFK